MDIGLQFDFFFAANISVRCVVYFFKPFITGFQFADCMSKGAVEAGAVFPRGGRDKRAFRRAGDLPGGAGREGQEMAPEPQTPF